PPSLICAAVCCHARPEGFSIDQARTSFFVERAPPSTVRTRNSSRIFDKLLITPTVFSRARIRSIPKSEGAWVMLSFDVESGAGAARRAHWDQVMRDVYGPRWQLNPARPAEFQMSMRAVQVGNVTLSRASLSQAEVSSRSYQSRNTAQHCYNI